jgi:TolB-like protein/lipoprotein NlpI
LQAQRFLSKVTVIGNNLKMPVLPRPEEVLKPSPAPARAWLARLSRLRGPLVAIAGVGAVLSGLVGYYTAYRTVSGTVAVAPASTATSSALPALPSIESDPSIAVLPLLNMTGDKDQEYFSDGIAEELLNLLARVPKLRVIARTSSFSFKGQQVEIATIARKLNVATVLEGSVRRSGNRARITVQLIRASDSARIWSGTYDKPLDDIFKVQDEIAAAVVEQLKISLLAALPKAQPVDPAAYQLILQADALAGQYTPESNLRAIELFEQALAIDPRATRALSGLASIYIFQANTGVLSPIEGFRRAREMANKTLAIDPRSAAAFAILGRVESEYTGDLNAAARALERALDLDSANLIALRNAGRLLQYIGRLDEAIALRKYQVALDPANPSQHGSLAFAYLSANRWDEAIASFKTALQMRPQAAQAHFVIGYSLLAKRDVKGALAEMQLEPSEMWRAEGLAMAYHALGRKTESNAELAALIGKYEKSGSFNIAEVFAYRGETDRSFEWLDKADAYRDSGLMLLTTSPVFVAMHRDPRWSPFVRKVGQAPDQLAAVKFNFTLPGK